jgi:hypothetical protein
VILHYLYQFGGGPAEEEVALGAVPVFLCRPVLAAARFPVGIGEAGDFLMGRGRGRNGWHVI